MDPVVSHNTGEGRHAPDLRIEGGELAYESRIIAENLDIAIPAGKITCIIGANACGKSTTLKALGRLLRPSKGQVILDGRAIQEIGSREFARRLGILPQSPTAPEGITVVDLVSRGRFPHQSWIRQWTSADEDAVADALEVTNTLGLATRSVGELSGGQRQRVWIALVLAQQTELLLLDEPTTYLDLSHQIEVLDLIVDLNKDRGRTIVVVLHDLNQAARYSHHLIAMKAGTVVAQGEPRDVLSRELVEDVFGVRCTVISDPFSGTPMVVPIGRHLAPDSRTSGNPQ